MAKHTEQRNGNGVADRLDGLESRIAAIEGLAMLGHELRRNEGRKKIGAANREAQRQSTEAWARQAPQREARFKQFVDARLVLGPGRRSQTGHALWAYREYLDAVKAPKSEHCTDEEFQVAILGLEDVELGQVTSPVGCKVAGFIGVNVIEEFRHRKAAADVEAEIGPSAELVAERALHRRLRERRERGLHTACQCGRQIREAAPTGE